MMESRGKGKGNKGEKKQMRRDQELGGEQTKMR